MNLYLGLFLCTLSLFFSATLSSSTGSQRSILREVNDNDINGVTDHDYAVELNGTNFDAVLKDTPATYAVVEFFAHWLVILISINLLCLCFLFVEFSSGY